MPQRLQNIYGHELIGLQVVLESKCCPDYSVLTGTIIDETKKMITVMTNIKKTRVPKEEVRLHLTLPNNQRVVLEGKNLISRPEDRTKIFRRKRRFVK